MRAFPAGAVALVLVGLVLLAFGGARWAGAKACLEAPMPAEGPDVAARHCELPAYWAGVAGIGALACVGGVVWATFKSPLRKSRA